MTEGVSERLGFKRAAVVALRSRWDVGPANRSGLKGHEAAHALQDGTNCYLEHVARIGDISLMSAST